MNWHKALEDIYLKLNANDFSDISQEIHREQLKGGTGGEIFSLVLTKLMAIKANNPRVYSIIKEETDDMLEFAKSIGYM